MTKIMIRKKIKGYIKFIYSIFVFKKKYYLNKNYNLKIIKNKHDDIFFGYYDLNPIKNDKHLLHKLSKKAKKNKKSIEIGYYDMKNNKINILTTSSAWNMQQGSRLRWSNIYNNCFYYNDFLDNKYCTHLYSIEQKKIIKTIEYPLYDLDNKEKYGVTINFERLQKLRPGYGYNCKFKNYDLNKDNLKEDGLYLIDLESNKSKKLVSLYDLTKDKEDKSKNFHYINHISFSPDGNLIMYFHLWNTKQQKRKSELYIYNIEKNKNELLESKVLVSHYTWKNCDELLITCVNNGKTEYRVYNVKEKSFKIINDKILNTDGHPTFINKNSFISDTYPIKNYQKLFKYDIKEEKMTIICDIFANPLLLEENRCDLHPKIHDKYISIDATPFKNKRNIFILKMKG